MSSIRMSTISALVFGGRPRKVVEHLERARFDRLISALLTTEVEGVLQKKFGWERSAIRRFCRPLWEASLWCEPPTTVRACRDAKDNYLLSLALDGQSATKSPFRSAQLVLKDVAVVSLNLSGEHRQRVGIYTNPFSMIN